MLNKQTKIQTSTNTSVPGHKYDYIAYIDKVVQHVSLWQTLWFIRCLVSFWCSIGAMGCLFSLDEHQQQLSVGYQIDS